MDAEGKAEAPGRRTGSDPGLLLGNNSLSAHIKGSGRRPNAKAVVSAMPVVMAKARARITPVVMAVTLFDLCGDCQNKARTSVTAITFWSF
jgi:hypothetical protein